MRHSRDLVLEELQEKVLQAMIAPPMVPISPPIIEDLGQGLVVKLATDHQVYRRGKPVVITLIETNTSQRAINVEQGPSIDGVYVNHNGREVWASNRGIQPMFVLLRTLAPGQSITQTTTWNGQTNIGPSGLAAGRLVIGTQIENVQPVSILIRFH